MTVIDAQGVSKQFLLKHNASVELKVRFLGLLHRRHRESVEEFWALRNVSLRIDRGEAVALVGRNGSGKSTFLKLIAAIHRPTTGRLLVARGSRIASMIELGVGFHPELTGRENVFLNAAIHGLTSDQTETIYGRIVSYSGLEQFIDVPIKNYSSGMHMRLGFSIAANLDPDVLLLDEIFAVGDADFQQRCVATLKAFTDRGKTIVFVSHAPSAVKTICRRACVLDRGELVFDGDVDSGLEHYDGLLAQRPAGDATPGPAHLRGAAEHWPSTAAQTSARAEAANWMFEFVRENGLRPGDRVLHVCPKGLIGMAGWTSFLAERNYVVVPGALALPELPGNTMPFDVAIAESIFPWYAFNTVARCIATVTRLLKPGGKFFATWFENPDPADFDPVVQRNGLTTHPDRPPYHYPLALVENVCQAVGARVDRVPSSGHPAGESVVVITRR